jgi:hypothetical protein
VEEMTNAFLSKNFTKYYKYVKNFYEDIVTNENVKALEEYTAILSVLIP